MRNVRLLRVAGAVALLSTTISGSGAAVTLHRRKHDFCVCRRLRFGPDAKIPVNRPFVELTQEWEAFQGSAPGSSTRRQVVQFRVGGNVVVTAQNG